MSWSCIHANEKKTEKLRRLRKKINWSNLEITVRKGCKYSSDNGRFLLSLEKCKTISWSRWSQELYGLDGLVRWARNKVTKFNSLLDCLSFFILFYFFIFNRFIKNKDQLKKIKSQESYVRIVKSTKSWCLYFSFNSGSSQSTFSYDFSFDSWSSKSSFVGNSFGSKLGLNSGSSKSIFSGKSFSFELSCNSRSS